MCVRWDPLNRAKCIASAKDFGRICYGDDKDLGFLYRFMDRLVGDDYDTQLIVDLFAIPIRSRSSAGWTIKANNGRGWRFIGEHAHRKYAYPNIGSAIESFRLRKTRQASIYDYRADNARLAIKLMLAPMEAEDLPYV